MASTRMKRCSVCGDIKKMACRQQGCRAAIEGGQEQEQLAIEGASVAEPVAQVVPEVEASGCAHVECTKCGKWRTLAVHPGVMEVIDAHDSWCCNDWPVRMSCDEPEDLDLVFSGIADDNHED